MKKIISCVLVFCFLFTVCSVNAFAADESVDNNAITRGYTEIFNSQLYRGDITGDNEVTEEDASKYLRVAANIEPKQENVSYDITGDGVVTTADARKALRVAAGLELTATDEEIFEYFLNELNSVKSTRPGFKRTATGTCKSARVTITGAPKGLTWDMNANNKEYKDYVKGLKSVFSLVNKEADYQQMVKEAEAIYEPQVAEKVIKPTSSQHYTYFPVQGLATSCRLSFDEIESISLKIIEGYYIITLTMDDYTYEGENPYPATAKDYTARQNLPYGKIFNIPEFSEDDGYELQKVALDKGKVIVKMDSTTGEIINAQYFFRCTSTVRNEEEVKDKDGNVSSIMVTTMKNIVEYDEYFDMQAKELTETEENK